jgi:ketosteroid isomerase-like protein
MSSDTISGWVRTFFHNVDNLDLPGFLSRLTDDAVVTFANNPPAVGKEAIGEGIGFIFGSVDGMKHSFVTEFSDSDRTFLESQVDYFRKDGSTVSVPAATVMHRRGELVDEMRIYVDLSPLFAPSA